VERLRQLDLPGLRWVLKKNGNVSDGAEGASLSVVREDDQIRGLDSGSRE
jgi:hypothetical protein